MDSSTYTTSAVTENFDQEFLVRARGEALDDSSSEEEGEPAPSKPIITIPNALTSVKDFIDLALSLNNQDMLNAAQVIQSNLHTERIRQKSFSRQKNITDFFTS